MSPAFPVPRDRRNQELLAYVDVFWTLAAIGAVMVPIALSLRSIDLRVPARGH